MQDSVLRSLLKGLVWRVFSTALTVSIILAVFHDTVQVHHKQNPILCILPKCNKHFSLLQSL